MAYDQRCWSWTEALVFSVSAALTTGHTTVIPNPLQGNEVNEVNSNPLKVDLRFSVLAQMLSKLSKE